MTAPEAPSPATPETLAVPTLLFEFANPVAVAAWRAIDDRVMGGVSRSTLRHDPAGHAVFEGTVSLERHGGFASVRSSPGERGLPGAAACLLEVRGDKKQFKLSLLTDDGFDSLNYQPALLQQAAIGRPCACRWPTSAPASVDTRLPMLHHSTQRASARSA
ncbi:Complex I intermediate-associated protein 30 (CIA30) [Methylibium sp. T29]|nr:Complex I intermediate-associated protein 30 (CIA30) [Methylibium sp. T29]